LIAIDTNVALRLILADDSRQLAAIETKLVDHKFFVSLTVFLETGWVLESRYALSRHEVAGALNALLELDSIEVARAHHALWAVEQYRLGADLADMLHLVSSAKRDGFLTFDRRLAAKAGSDVPVVIETLR
jgi:predicted nucleic-acid-binding protein